LLRFRALVALKRYEEAAREAAQIASMGDSTPFEVRLLAAHLPFLENFADAVPALGMLQNLAHRLCDISARDAAGGFGQFSEQALSERLQVLRTLSHVSLSCGHGSVAVGELQAAIAAVESLRSSAPEGAQKMLERERLRLHSLLGRHHVSAGNTTASAQAFAIASKCCCEEEAVTHFLDLGLVAVASGDYNTAKENFAKAAVGAREKVAAARKKGHVADKIVDEAVSAENNLAVCRLYTKELRQGVQGLEDFVRQDPALFLRSSVTQNLAALYEFLPDAVHRRAVLREVAAAFCLEDLGPKSFEPS
jgi:tetratricopeptide (TPR) repeat protein